MACSSTANTWRAASRRSVARDLGLTLGVEEAHELFLGKTVDGVLDAIAARTGTRPSTAWVYNWAFATAHAFLRELQGGGRRAALRSKNCAAAVIGWRWHRSRRSRAYSCRCRWRASPGSSANTSTSPRWWRVPSRRRTSIYSPRSGSAPRRAECIVIEDSPAGAAAAQAAGMRVHRICAAASTAAAMQASGAQVIRSMDELIAAIEA